MVNLELANFFEFNVAFDDHESISSRASVNRKTWLMIYRANSL